MVTAPADPLSRHLFQMACNNAWANLRLLRACGELSQDELLARRVSFFSSIKSTLNHNATVDAFYIDAIERALAGREGNADARSFFDPEEPYDTCAAISVAQRALDRRLVDACATLRDDQRELPVPIQRRDGVVHEPLVRILAHLFQHQIHHRGQAHAMLAGTSVAPPQLDEFFCANEAALRAEELADLGLDERTIWP